jgi:SPP1 family predicted phage head-tail adaptor
MIIVGKFDRLITIQQPDGQRSETSNEPSGNWEDVAQVWAKKEFFKGREKMQGDQPISVGDIAFHIRYRDDVREKMRVVFEDVTYNIFSVEEIGRREVLRIYCQRLS